MNCLQILLKIKDLLRYKMLETVVNFPKFFGAAYSFISGLILGSFLNVVVLRAFSGESIVLPPSKCPQCNNKLKWFHNIPVVSYLFLRGKCAFCNQKISVQYPLVELVTGCTFLGAFLIWGFSFMTLFACLFAFMFIVLSVTDLKEKVIFVVHALWLAAFGVIFNLLNIAGGDGLQNLIDSIIGIFVGFFVIEIISLLSKKLFGQRVFGEGDSYILGAIGAIVGYKVVGISFILGAVIQAILAVPLIVAQYVKQQKYASAFSLVSFLVGVVLYYSFMDFFLSNVFIQLVFYFAIFILAMLACFQMIRDVKNGSSMTLLPFGPALILGGALIFIAQNTSTLQFLVELLK